MSGIIKEGLRKIGKYAVTPVAVGGGEFIAQKNVILPNLLSAANDLGAYYDKVKDLPIFSPSGLTLIEKAGQLGAWGVGAFIVGMLGVSALAIYGNVIGIIPDLPEPVVSNKRGFRDVARQATRDVNRFLFN